jgi:hypothetical protein
MFPDNPPRPDLTTSQFFKLYGAVYKNNPVFYKSYFYYTGLRQQARMKYLNFASFDDYYKNAKDYDSIAEYEVFSDESKFK